MTNANKTINEIKNLISAWNDWYTYTTEQESKAFRRLMDLASGLITEYKNIAKETEYQICHILEQKTIRPKTLRDCRDFNTTIDIFEENYCIYKSGGVCWETCELGKLWKEEK